MSNGKKSWATETYSTIFVPVYMPYKLSTCKYVLYMIRKGRGKMARPWRKLNDNTYTIYLSYIGLFVEAKWLV